MVDFPHGVDALSTQPFVCRDQVGKACIGPRRMSEAEGSCRRVGQVVPSDDGDPVVLLIEGEKCDPFPLHRDIGAEHRSIPRRYFGEAASIEHDVRKIRGRNDRISRRHLRRYHSFLHLNFPS